MTGEISLGGKLRPLRATPSAAGPGERNFAIEIFRGVDGPRSASINFVYRERELLPYLIKGTAPMFGAVEFIRESGSDS